MISKDYLFPLASALDAGNAQIDERRNGALGYGGFRGVGELRWSVGGMGWSDYCWVGRRECWIRFESLRVEACAIRDESAVSCDRHG